MISTLHIYQVSENYGDLGFSSVGGRSTLKTYPIDTGFDQQWNQQRIRRSWMDQRRGNSQSPIFPFGTANIQRCCKRYPIHPNWNGSGTLVVSGIGAERVAALQVAQHLYSTSLVVQMRDSLLRLQKEQFYSISLELLQREQQKTLLVLVLSLSKVELELPHTQEDSTRLLLVLQQYLVFLLLHPVSIHQKELIYTSLVVDTQTSRLDLLHNQTKGIYASIWGTYSSRYRLHTSLWYRKKHWYRNWTYLSPTVLEEYGDPGIVTTRFIPKYPSVGPVITLQGRSISRTNAPISTHGVIYILGIGTAGNGVGRSEEKGDLSGVEFGAKERFIPATEIGAGSLLFDFQTTGAEARPISVFGYYGDDKDPGTSGQITIRQEGGIFTQEKIIKIYETDGTGTFSYSGVVQRRSNNILRSWIWFSIRNRWYRRDQDMQNLLLEHPYSMERQRLHSLHRLQKYCNNLHYLEGLLTQIRVRWIWNSYTQKRHQCSYWCSSISRRIWYIQCIWWCCRESTVEPSSARAILTDITGVAETRKISSIPRLRSIWYIYNIWRTYTSRYRLHTSIHWYWKCYYFWNCWREQNCPEIGVWYCNILWFCNSQIYSRFRRRYSPLRYKRIICTYRTQSSLRILRRRQRSRHIWYYNNIWYFSNQKDICLPRLCSIRNTYNIQYFTCTSRRSLHSFNWYWCCSPLPDRWNWSRILRKRQLHNSRILQGTCWI